MTQDAAINRLRANLDAARKHIAAMADAIEELDRSGEWKWSEADKATLHSIHVSGGNQDRTDQVLLALAARTWLRRPAA